MKAQESLVGSFRGSSPPDNERLGCKSPAKPAFVAVFVGLCFGPNEPQQSGESLARWGISCFVGRLLGLLVKEDARLWTAQSAAKLCSRWHRRAFTARAHRSDLPASVGARKSGTWRHLAKGKSRGGQAGGRGTLTGRSCIRPAGCLLAPRGAIGAHGHRASQSRTWLPLPGRPGGDSRGPGRNEALALAPSLGVRLIAL